MAESEVKLPNGEQVTIRHKDGASEQDILQFAFSEYVVNQDPGTVIGRSIAQGIDNLQQAYGSSLEGIGNILDAESLQQLGGDIVANNQAEIDARRFREQQSITDRDGIAGAYDYVAELAGQSAPQMATTFAGAGAGGAIGLLGGPLAPLTVPIGAFVGGFLANMPYFYGSNRERQKEAIEKGYKVEMDEGAAALAAIPQSALDSLFAAIGAKFLSTPLMKLQGGILTKATVGAGTGSIIEAPTEMGQTVLERYQAGLPLDSDEAIKEIVAAGLGGAVLGGLFGGAGGAVAGIRAPKETKEVEEKEQGQKQTFTVNYTNESTGKPTSTKVEADNEQQAQEIANKSLKKTAREGTIVVQKPIEPEPEIDTSKDKIRFWGNASDQELDNIIENRVKDAENELENTQEAFDTTESEGTWKKGAREKAINELEVVIPRRIKRAKLARDRAIREKQGRADGSLKRMTDEEFGNQDFKKQTDQEPTPAPEPEVTAEASATFMPRRFVGEGAITAPPFFQQFSPDQYEDGRFIDLETKQDLSDQTFEGGSIRIEKGRPVLETSDNASNTIIDKKASEEGSLVRTNLFKQKAGWKWTKAPDEAPSTIVSVEQGSKHFYTLDFTSSKPLTLKTYPDKKSEPRGRPTTRGKVKLGKVIGEIDIRGKKHSVYDKVSVGEPEVTAGATPAGGQGEQTASQAEASRIQNFIEDTFGEIVSKIGTSINVNPNLERVARYNATTGVIEINSAKIVELQSAGQIDIVDDAYIKSVMREEMIHAAMSKIILQKAKGKKEGEAFQSFMSSLGKSLTPEQRTAIAEVYSGLETDAQFGAEYSRAAIQQLLYGDVTESFITQGPAFTKLKNLLRSVQSYLAKTFGADVTTDPEAAGIIRASAELLQAADPNARPTNQKIVDQSLAYSVSVNPNAEVTSQEVAESGKPPSQKKLNLNFARKYLFTLSSVLNSIHPRLKRLVRDYYGAIQGRVLNYQTRTAPFFKKYRGIKNEKDKRRLKQLLLYSPPGDPEADPLIQEQNKLLRKYDMLNDYNLEVRPVLDELRANLEAEGVDIGYLPEYMPRRIKDLDKVKNRSGNELNEAFENYIDERNKKIEKARLDVLEDQLNGRTPTEANLKLAGEVVIEIGSDRTAAFEAQQWDVFTMGTKTRGGSKIPGNLKERTAYLDDVIPDDLLDAYEDPSVAMENYIFNIVSATENVKLVGRRFTTEGDKIKVPVASELGKLIQELRANGEISNENADYTVPDIFRMILTAQQGERIYLQIARTFGYGTLLVEFTSTLSQLYDLPFIMLDNGVLGTAGAMFGQRLKGEDFGIDTQQVSAEFSSDNRALEKAVRLGLKATGFTKLDQIMKETNLTANYNRYRKLSRGYYKDRNSSNSKKFVAELTAMGYSEQEQVKLIADLKEGNRNSAYIRSLLFNKLAETQPLTQAEMALGIVNNPNLRLFVAMKSFMIKQLNFVKDRMLVNMARGTKAQRIKASKDLALLLTFMVMAGFPVDALKDFLAGRIGYMSDYLFNGIFRIAGVSRYTAFQIRKEGAGEALLDFTLPVAVQQFTDILGEVGRVTSGERAITESKFVTLLPFSDVINRIFGFRKERERREYMRRAREGERPFLVPPGAI